MAKANGHFEQFQSSSDADLQGAQLASRSTASDVASEARVEVDCVVLSDGRILDLIRSLATPDQLLWLVWKDVQYCIMPRVVFEDHEYVPPKLPRGVGRALRLPTGLGPLLSAQELIAEIESRVRAFVDLPEDDTFLIAVFNLSTFFADLLPLTPYLDICGPPGSGKSTLLRVLSCTARRALHASAITGPSIYKLTDLVGPTLLLDESDFDGGINSRQIMRLLRAGNHPGADVYVNGQRFRVFCPKVVASRTPLPDAALASRSIHVAMTPTRKELRLLDPAAEQNLAAEMQGKLERFRLEHYRDLCIPQLDNSGLSARTKDLARVLATPLRGDAELTSRLLTCLKARDEDAFLDRFGEPEWIVAATLFAFSHRPGLQVYIGNLAEEANRMLAELGETYALTAKGVGVIARKSLRTHTTKDGRGFYVSLTASRRRTIHELARDMGISKADILDSGTLRAGYAGPPCRLCTELGLLTRRDGTILRSVILPPPGRNRKGLFEPKP